MARFPDIQSEAIIQEMDKTRIVAKKSFFTPDEGNLVSVEIQPGALEVFYDVTGNDTPANTDDWFLDWKYPTEGTETISVRITTDTGSTTVTKTIEVISEANDKLLSADTDLIGHESDILDYLRDGRDSYLDKHRVARDRILTYLDEQRITDVSGNPLTKDSLIDVSSFKDWAKFETLMIIFGGFSNQIDDIFKDKENKYESLRNMARNRTIRVDLNGDAVVDSHEGVDLATVISYKR